MRRKLSRLLSEAPLAYMGICLPRTDDSSEVPQCEGESLREWPLVKTSFHHAARNV